MQWILIILLLVAGASIGLYFIKFRPNEKKIHKLEEEGSYEDAIVEYSRLFDKKRLSNNGLWRLINLYIKTGRRKKAIDKLKYSLKYKKLPEEVQPIDVKIKLATLLYNEKLDEEALRLLLEIYKEGDYVPEILLKIGTIAYSQKNYTNAKRFLLKYVDIVQKDEEALCMCAFALMNLNDIKQVISIFSNLTEIAPKKARYYFYAAICYLMINNFEKAKDFFNKAIEQGLPKDKLLNSFRGKLICNIVDKNFEEATENIDNIISLSLSSEIDSNELKQRVAVDKAILFLFINDADNKMFVANELANAVDNISLKDNDFKANLIKTLKEEDISQNNGKSQITENIRGFENLTLSYPEKKIKLLIRWIEIGFPKEDITFDFILTRADKFDIDSIFASFNSQSTGEEEKTKQTVTSPLVDRLMGVSKQTIVNTARKILDKMGLKIIDEIYVDEDSNMNLGDGVDFIAEEKSIDRFKYFVAFRRWNSDNIGEFALRSIVDTIKIIKFDRGIFIAPGKLSKEAMAFLDKHQNIRFIGRTQLEKLLGSIEELAEKK